MRALLSVSDKAGLVPFAKGLVDLGYSLISTGGTFKVLQEAGLPVVSVDQVTGFPEMMDGRVKTLHPVIHGGLLALRDHPDHMSAANAHGIEMIDLVVVNLYPFEATIAKPNVSLAEAIENIDIGGPSMIRSAAKNHGFVGVVVNPLNYDAVLADLNAHSGRLSDSMRQLLALEAFTHTSRYDAIIANYLEKNYQPEVFPVAISPYFERVDTLRYGENPHQSAAFYAQVGAPGIADLVIHQGKALSYNNLLDLESAWQLVIALPKTGAVVVKHNNPCGVAVDETLAGAYRKAFDADSVSAFGGIVGLNRPLDEATAHLICETFLEVVIAPGYAPEALEVLSKKPNLRVVQLPVYSEAPAQVLRYIHGGVLVQTPDAAAITADAWTTPTKVTPSQAQLDEMVFANTVVRSVKSNAIVVTKNGQTLGIGAGQMSRVEAVEIALRKAGDAAKGAVLASDAFFPFSDSVALAAKAGIAAIVQPGGSKKDQESIDQCDHDGLTMVFTHVRHFKH